MNRPLLDKSLDSATQIVLFYEEFSVIKGERIYWLTLLMLIASLDTAKETK